MKNCGFFSAMAILVFLGLYTALAIEMFSMRYLTSRIDASKCFSTLVRYYCCIRFTNSMLKVFLYSFMKSLLTETTIPASTVLGAADAACKRDVAQSKLARVFIFNIIFT